MVMDVMAAAARIEAAGGHVIHMEVGQPAASAPKVAIAAAHAALDAARIDYTSALGIPTLRARIAKHYRDTYGCAVDPERIVITTGSSGGFILAFLSMFEPGDRVAVTVPGYPPYRHILTALGCEPVLIETSSATRHALTGEALLAAHRKTPLKGVLVGSPANPTGTMMSREALTSLMAAAESAGIRFISDQGESPASSAVDSHFDRFARIFKDFDAAGSFQPSYPVAVNPNTTPALDASDPLSPEEQASEATHGPGRIHHAATRLWANLFNVRYRVLLTALAQSCLSGPLTHPSNGTLARNTLKTWVFDEMLERVAKLLPELGQHLAADSKATREEITREAEALGWGY
jgi:hypothetical protein